MDKNKINIDQFFKTSLQNFEGNANEAMFDAIKNRIDKTSPKVTVDDFFKGAMLNLEGSPDETMFDSIKSKVDASKVTIDVYFKEALLDYNSYALPIPFSEIQNKLDREKIIDEHFKNALQNYEGKAQDEEFAVIRERVIRIQQVESRKRYAWLLLLLLIPAWFTGVRYFENKNSISAASTSNGSNEAVASENRNNENTANQNSISNEKDKINSAVIRSGNPGLIDHDAVKSYTATSQNNSKTNATKTFASNTISESTLINGKETEGTLEKETQHVTSENGNASSDNVITPEVIGTKTTIPKVSKNSAKTTIRKPKPKYLVQVFGAAAMNGRYLHTDDNSKKYLETRTASDKITTKLNFGVDLLRQYGKFKIGFGLHENQFGQKGSYQLNKNIHDSFPVWSPLPNRYIIGYLYRNYRDTSFYYSYNNNFSSIEIPLHFSYMVCNFTKFEFEVGISGSLSYILAANGALPNATSSDIVLLKNTMKSINRIGGAGTISMKLNYKLTSKWQLGTELYSKTNLTSLYKKNTGINELPYAFGMRCGLGLKF